MNDLNKKRNIIIHLNCHEQFMVLFIRKMLRKIKETGEDINYLSLRNRFLIWSAI